MNRLRSAGVLLAVSVATGYGAGVAAATVLPPGLLASGDVSAALSQSLFAATHPDLVSASAQVLLGGEPVQPGLAVQGDQLVSVATLTSSTIAADPLAGLTVDTAAGPIALAPSDVSPSVSQATLVNGVAALFANTQTSTDVLMRPLTAGCRHV